MAGKISEYPTVAVAIGANDLFDISALISTSPDVYDSRGVKIATIKTAVAQTLAEVLATGNTTGANNIVVNSGQAIVYSNSGFLGTLTTTTLTDNRAYTLQNASGTLAFLSDIVDSSLATADQTLTGARIVNLNNFDLTFKSAGPVVNLLHLDEANTRVGIGTNTPSKFFEINFGTVNQGFRIGTGIGVGGGTLGMGLQFKRNGDVFDACEIFSTLIGGAEAKIGYNGRQGHIFYTNSGVSFSITENSAGELFGFNANTNSAKGTAYMVANDNVDGLYIEHTYTASGKSDFVGLIVSVDQIPGTSHNSHTAAKFSASNGNSNYSIHSVAGLIKYDGQTATGATGGADTLPANPVGFINIDLDGTTRKIPYYAT